MVSATRSKKQSRITANDRAILKARGTPASFAVTASHGRYKTPRHVLFWNRIAMDVAGGRRKRVILQAPPRHGKSHFWSEHFPAWHIGTFPDKRVILTSYEATFAASWGRKSRGLIAEHGHLFGVKLSESKQSADDWELDGYAGGMLTAGIGGGITGRGCAGLVIDDPTKNAEESLSVSTREKHWDWFQSTASTRLEPGGWIVVIMTRWHPEDLAGRLLMEQPDEWEVISLPALAMDNDPLGRLPDEALWPERWPREVLEKTRANIDTYWWKALYQQQPSRHGRFEWPDEYFQGVWATEWPDSFDMRLVACDPSKGKDSKKGDYWANVFVGVTDGKLWVDSELKRRPATEGCEAFVRMCDRYKTVAAGVEINQFQELLMPEIQRICERDKRQPLPLYGINNTVNKNLRISRIGPYLARKEILFRDTPDNRLMVQQLKDFPNGDHDDGPDGLEQAIRLGIETHGGIVDDGLGNNLLERTR